MVVRRRRRSGEMEATNYKINRKFYFLNKFNSKINEYFPQGKIFYFDHVSLNLKENKNISANPILLHSAYPSGLEMYPLWLGLD